MDAPASGLPSNKTSPSTGLVRALPQPASSSTRMIPQPWHALRFCMVSSSARLKITSTVAIIAAAEELIGSVVDILIDESHGAIDEREIDATGMIRFESPSHGPIHNATRLVTGRIGRAVALAGGESGRRIGHAVDFPIDRLN